MSLFSAQVQSGTRNGETATLNIAIGPELIEALEVKIGHEHHLVEKDEVGNEISKLPVIIGAVVASRAADQVRDHIVNLGRSNMNGLDLFYRAIVAEGEVLVGEIDFDTQPMLNFDD